MATFILQRLSQALFVLLAAALVSFALLRYVGDPVNNMVGQAASTRGSRGHAPGTRA